MHSNNRNVRNCFDLVYIIMLLKGQYFALQQKEEFRTKRIKAWDMMTQKTRNSTRYWYLVVQLFRFPGSCCHQEAFTICCP